MDDVQQKTKWLVEWETSNSEHLFANWMIEKAEALEAENEHLRAGFEFTDQRGKSFLVRTWNGNLWLFYKHPDGQWVSLRQISLAAAQKE